MRVIAMGTDIVEIKRIKGVLERQPRFKERVFTPFETAYCLGRSDPYPSFAVRFAAKEAVFKALGTGKGIRFIHIEVRTGLDRKPSLVLRGQAQAVADSLGINEFQLSLSHTREYALAFVILGRKEIKN